MLVNGVLIAAALLILLAKGLAIAPAIGVPMALAGGLLAFLDPQLMREIEKERRARQAVKRSRP